METGVNLLFHPLLSNHGRAIVTRSIDSCKMSKVASIARGNEMVSILSGAIYVVTSRCHFTLTRKGEEDVVIKGEEWHHEKKKKEEHILYIAEVCKKPPRPLNILPRPT